MPNVSYESEMRNRECPGCHVRLTATSRNFYITPSTGRLGRCHDCHRAYYADRAAARRSAGRTTRPVARTLRGDLFGSDRRFGVEIEFIGGAHVRDAAVRAMNTAGVACQVEGYNHQTRSHWKIVTDASVRGGYELVSPVLSGDDGREQVRKACAALTAAGASVNRTTGIHVHHDVRDLSSRNVARAARFYQESKQVIDTLVAPSRRGGCMWAKPFSAREMDAIESSSNLRELATYTFSGEGRYRAFNIAAYAKHGTIEFRQHQGSLNANKILGWIEFGQAILTFSKDESVEIPRRITFDTMSATLVMAGGLTIETANYLRERTVALNATTEDALYAMVS